MNRSTSKASYREEKENGNVMSQEDKILSICKESKLSLQEIMKLYRQLYGSIELSSVSARVNKLKEDKKLTEVEPRKCTITKKTINPVTALKCTHNKYRSSDYMMYSNAVKAFEKGEIKIVGTPVIKCEDCGADISHAQRVKVKSTKQKRQPTKSYTIVVRGKKAYMICYDGETIEEAEKVCKLKFGKNFESISDNKTTKRTKQ